MENKIKLILFDLDGTLIESTKDIHYQALNEALKELQPNCIITKDEHETIYDALSTRQKLDLLVKEKGLNPNLQDAISNKKQEITFKMLENYIFNINYSKTFNFIKKQNIKIGVCTNSIKKTTEVILNKLGIANLVDLVLTNEDVINPKPNSEMYLKAMNILSVKPENTLIFEDSKHGIESAEKSNAYVKIIKNISEINSRSISWILKLIETNVFNINGVLKTIKCNKGNLQLKIKCQECNNIRFIELTNIKHSKFTSKCKICNARKQYNPNNIDKSGYRLTPFFILNDEDKKLCHTMVNKANKIREHRIIMAKYLNRPLKSDEIVHHKNGCKTDNRIDNLELLTKNSHHVGYGDVFYQKWQEEIISFKAFIKDNCKVNVLIPMSGMGSRFKHTHTRPKPLIEIRPNLTMIELVVQNLNIDGKLIFLVLKEHYEKYKLKEILKKTNKDIEIIIVDSITEGAACTTLLAKNLINSETPLFIANSDQYVENWCFNDFRYQMIKDNSDGGIVIFKANDPKWSFVKLNDKNNVIEVAEKQPISDNATIGFYYWSKGSDYVKYAEQMIEKNIRVNGEFYVAPVYNEAILDGKIIKPYSVDKMWGLGTPTDLNLFLENYKE